MSFNQVSVSNPAAASYADGSTVTAFAGKQGEQLVTDLHGKYYTGAYRGHCFFANTGVSGTTVPVSTTTTATFAIYNPIGSGINMELIAYDAGVVTSITTVVGSVMLGFSAVLTVAPTGLTALTGQSSLYGSNSAPLGRVYSAATIVATTVWYTMAQITSVNGAGVASAPLIHYEFDGKVVLAPGTLAHVAGTTAQTQAFVQNIVWAEWSA